MAAILNLVAILDSFKDKNLMPGRYHPTKFQANLITETWVIKDYLIFYKMAAIWIWWPFWNFLNWQKFYANKDSLFKISNKSEQRNLSNQRLFYFSQKWRPFWKGGHFENQSTDRNLMPVRNHHKKFQANLNRGTWVITVYFIFHKNGGHFEFGDHFQNSLTDRNLMPIRNHPTKFQANPITSTWVINVYLIL